jgi:hypothetical protein
LVQVTATSVSLTELRWCPKKQAAAQGVLAQPGVGVLHLCFPTHVPGDLYLAAGTGTGQTGRMIRIGVVTPHAAIGPEAEFPAMAPGWITTRVARIPVDMAAADVMGGPTDRGRGSCAIGVAAG